MDEWMDEWIDGWMNGWMDGWTDEWWKEVIINQSLFRYGRGLPQLMV